MAQVVRFENVGLAAPETILENVSVELALEGITAVVGPSGSGKSMLLRMCNRLEVPTSGRVLLDGDDLATLDPLELRRRVGMVFQRPTVFAGTVTDNLRVASPHASQDELDAHLQRCGLDVSVGDRPAAELSGGEAQRMCLARTLLTAPSVLLCDEVTSSLDDANRHRIEHLVADLSSDGMGVLWVTHDMAQAARLARQALLIERGTVVAVLSHRQLVERADGHGTSTSHDWEHD